MADISRVALFGKLNSLCYRAIESSTVFCKLRGNPYVEVVHWMHQILQLQDSDLVRIIRQYDLDPATLARDLRRFLDSGYRLGEIRGFDLFPRTGHVETVVTLDR